jgi:hypothetical protein
MAVVKPWSAVPSTGLSISLSIRPQAIHNKPLRREALSFIYYVSR